MNKLVLVGVVLAQIKVDPTTRSLRDETGRQIMFHGVNVVYKEPPYIPDTTGEFTP